jgi:hypothetical protein
LSLAVFLNEFREHNFLYKKSSDTWFISIYKGPSWSVSYGSFNNIPVISRRSILSVKEPGENYRPAASHFLPSFVSFGQAVFRGEDFKKSANQKQELSVVAMFVNGSGHHEQSVERTFHRCFLPQR